MKVAQVPFWTKKEIAARVAEMGGQITHDYRGRHLAVLGVAAGSFIFMADLVRHIRRPVRCGFIDSSAAARSDAITELVYSSTFPVEGTDLLLVEDVLDTGVTLSYLRQHLESRGTETIRVAALLDKPACRRVNIHADYIGFQVPDQHFVGYGLDCGGAFRNLPYLTCMTEMEPRPAAAASAGA